MEYRGFTLDPFQSQAIEVLKRGDSVLVSAPTGTGKTVVADWIVETAMQNQQEVIYTAPIKALSNQKFRDYVELFGEDNVGLVTGDLVVRRDAPCRVMTTEILRNILLCGESVDKLKAVIIDEIHFLDDRERGTTWEEVLIYLPKHVQIVGLSATLANLDEFADWLSFVRGQTVTVVKEHKRAVPLSYWICTKETGIANQKAVRQAWKSSGRKHPRQSHRRNRRGKGQRDRRDRSNETNHIDVFKAMGKNHRPYLYFVFSRARAEDLARHLGRWLRHPLTDDSERAATQKHLQSFLQQPGAETALTPDLEHIYLQGVAFHHAGLHVMLKGLVEQLYEAKLIKVLYCTGTFALGINMPARAAVFDSLKRYDGYGLIPLPTREFMQMAGRAGRRGLDSEGTVVMRMDLGDFGEFDPQIKGYLEADYEPVHSRFSLSFNSVVNLLHRHPLSRIQELIEKSFLSWHRQKVAKKERNSATNMAQKLRDAGFDITDKLPTKWHKQRKIIQKLNRRADRHENASWREFEERVEFLQVYDYIGVELEFYAGAKALMHFQIQEIFSTELFLAGIFDELSPPMLFGLCCGMCLELPRGTSVYDAKKHRGFTKRVQKIARSDIVMDASYLTGQPVIWDGTVLPLGKAWAEGKDLSEILNMFHSNTDISGSLISGFRRAKDLLNQLKGVWIDFPEKHEMLKALLKDVSRDEVEVID